MAKKIEVIRGGIKALAKECNCRPEHVRNSLKGVVDSMLSKKIRRKAIELDLVKEE